MYDIIKFCILPFCDLRTLICCTKIDKTWRKAAFDFLKTVIKEFSDHYPDAFTQEEKKRELSTEEILKTIGFCLKQLFCLGCNKKLISPLCDVCKQYDWNWTENYETPYQYRAIDFRYSEPIYDLSDWMLLQEEQDGQGWFLEEAFEMAMKVHGGLFLFMKKLKQHNENLKRESLNVC